MAANRRKQDDKNLEILRDLISHNGNKHCFDCNQRGPTYVNTTIGSFVCSKCSGMLRGLTPPHRVKSISMATFTQDEIEFIKTRGNDYCRRVWLGLYEGESVNSSDEQSVKDFMSDKYEKKTYFLEASPNNSSISNGISSSKTKTKTKNGNNGSTLISIAPPTSISTNHNNMLSGEKSVNDLFTASDAFMLVNKPANNITQSFTSRTSTILPQASNFVPIPEFPVDFSTANIYNSSQVNNNSTSDPIKLQNNNTSQCVGSNLVSNSNDRYAALADLDMALRQQKMKNMEENVIENNRNPFQSTTNDILANKNPFCNGGWSNATTATFNPFMPSLNNNVNSKNPFL